MPRGCETGLLAEDDEAIRTLGARHRIQNFVERHEGTIADS